MKTSGRTLSSTRWISRVRAAADLSLPGAHILRPDFIVGLLQNVGSHVDPIKLIRRIPKGLEIPELRNSLIKILQDYNLQVRALSARAHRWARLTRAGRCRCAKAAAPFSRRTA